MSGVSCDDTNIHCASEVYRVDKTNSLKLRKFATLSSAYCYYYWFGKEVLKNDSVDVGLAIYRRNIYIVKSSSTR